MKQNKKKSREFKRRLFYKNKMCFIASVIMTIVMSFLNLMISWLIQQIMDSMANQNMQSVVRCAWIAASVVIAYTVANAVIELYIQDFYNGPCSSTAIMHFRG